MQLNYNAIVTHDVESEKGSVKIEDNWGDDLEVYADSEQEAREKFENLLESKGIYVHEQDAHHFSYVS